MAARWIARAERSPTASIGRPRCACRRGFGSDYERRWVGDPNSLRLSAQDAMAATWHATAPRTDDRPGLRASARAAQQSYRHPWRGLRSTQPKYGLLPVTVQCDFYHKCRLINSTLIHPVRPVSLMPLP